MSAGKALPAFAAAAALALAADWPQWRGPDRDGVLPASVAPKQWPEKLARRWQVTVGEGHSSPILAGGKIFVLARQQEDEVVLAIDAATGKTVWRHSYAAPYTMNQAAVRHGKGPKSTPLVHNGRLYTFGINGILSCLDAASGKLLWRKEFGGQYKATSPLYGTAMSPMVEGGLLITHAGGHDGGALTAFNAVSGTVKWTWAGDGPGYASPIAVDLAGARQVVTQTQQNIAGVDAKSGALLWTIGFTTPYVQNIVTPLVYRDLFILSGLGRGTMAVRVARKDGRFVTETVWHNKEVSMYMNSPLLQADLLFGLANRDRGRYFCLDARTGSILWMSDPRQGENAAMILAGEHFFGLNNDAEMIVARASGKAFDVVRRYTVAQSPTWAHPLVVDGGIVIKDATTLSLWGW